MRRTPVLFLFLFAALALAQARQTRDGLRLAGNCGAGYIQADFLGRLSEELQREFGERRAADMLEHLVGAKPEARDVLALLNGETTKSTLRDLLGARGEEPSLARKALERAVSAKDKKLLFGALVMTMVTDGDVDPSSEFCRVVGESRGLNEENFEKLCRGNVSTSFIEECFGFTSKDDQKDMQGFLNSTWDSPYLLHPLGASLAKRGGVKGTYDAAKFPKASAGMPGCGDEYKSGQAGGLPFDKDLPPVPYYGENLEKFFE